MSNPEPIPYRTELAGQKLSETESAFAREVEAARADLKTAQRCLEAEVAAHEETRRKLDELTAEPYEPMELPPRPDTWRECLAQNMELRAAVEQLPLEVKRQTRHLERRANGLQAERDDFLEEIRALHTEYVDADCVTCDGMGEYLDTVVENYPSARDPYQPAETEKMVTCPDCLGTKKEWGSV